MRGHADAETLAAFREELLSRRKAARMSAHLAACPRCAGLDAQLTEVTGLLTRSTAPPMPDALTARIEAAIAAEAVARAATTADGAVAAGTARAGGGAGAGAGARDGAGAGARARDGAAGGPGQRSGRAARPPAPGRARLALRVAAVTAAVVVVAGGGYGVSQLLSMHVTGGKRPLLVDIARYQGHPAAIIVVPATPGTLQALVVPSDCTAAAPHVLRPITPPAPR